MLQRHCCCWHVFCMACSRFGAAISRPSRSAWSFPIRPGSTPDIVGRTLSTKLQEALGQPFVVDNRTGAGGNIGAEAVAKAPPDGYTLLIGINGPAAINKFLYKDLAYDSDKDLLPVSLLASAPQMLVVTPSVDASDFKSVHRVPEDRIRAACPMDRRAAAAPRTSRWNC